jgi:hypothetical protein
MKAIQHILITIITIHLLASCEKVIEFNSDTVEPMIVVNSFINPDSLIYTHLSKSKFFLSNKNGFDFINNADVSLYINQVFKEKLSFTSDGMYLSNIKPKTGETVKIIVKADGFDDAESTAIIPEKADILSADTTMVTRQNYVYTNGNDTMAIDQGGDINFRIRIKDPGDVQNYYRLVAKRRTEIPNGEQPYVQEFFMSFTLEGFEASTGGLIGIIDGSENYSNQHLITDELFNGKEYVLRFKLDYSTLTVMPGFEDFFGYHDKNITTEDIIINLQTISREMYLYLKSKESAEGIFDGVFSEPVQIYNNISNGIGILGSYTNNQLVYKIR